MPLRRYQTRNEYGSSDPELYRQADKDDPEALLEAVSMSGLVGLLRQLGDLAEFAAEIFHDLHEEVLATASRGHGLMVRVQQLETEFPLVEKALLSQTNHSLFFYNTGADWHPSMRSQENLIAQGDLPRFIMDSYEECRAPPRLFLLDKFDVAGAGACLKRYSDPAIFKEETVLGDLLKEKKIRKVKKKGMRRRNGATPEFVQVPHTKLHQLFLEERVEITNSNPSRLVKLKRRQFNESSFCSKNGKSYMEKFVDTLSPDSKTVFEDHVVHPALVWTPENIVPEAVEIHSPSPMQIGLQMTSAGKRSVSERLCSVNLKEMVIDEKEMMEPASAPSQQTDEILDLQDVRETQLGKISGNKENGVDGFHHDEITNERENYVDAVAMLESEVDADSEFDAGTCKRINNAGEHEADSITTDEQGEHQLQFSDSHSWDYSVSDDGNTFIRRGSSTFSYSDGQSNLIENILSDSEGVSRAVLFSEAGTSKCFHDNQISSMLENTSEKLLMPASDKEEGIYMSALPTEQSARLWPFPAEAASTNHIRPVFSLLEGQDSVENLDNAVSSAVPSYQETEHHSRRASEDHSLNFEEVGESTSSDPLPHLSTLLDLPDVAETDNSHTRETLHNDVDVDNIDQEQRKSGLSFAEVSSEDQLHLAGLSEVGDSTGLIPFYHSSTAPVANNVDVDKPVPPAIRGGGMPIAELNSECYAGKEDILHINSKEQHYSLLAEIPINEQKATTDHCHDDVTKHEENSHVIVGDDRVAWTEAIYESNLAKDILLTSSDDHIDRRDDVAVDPSSNPVSSLTVSSPKENGSTAESSSLDAVSSVYLKMQELDPDPATSDETDHESNGIAGTYGFKEEENAFQEEQDLNPSDLKSPEDFPFEMEEQCLSSRVESLVISDSQGIEQPAMGLEAKPASKRGLLLISEAELFSPLNNELVEHEEQMEQPPELQADAPGTKLSDIDETSSDRSIHTAEQMQSFNLLCQEDILSKPGPLLESLLEVENHVLDVERPNDSKVVASLPDPQSDTTRPSDSTEDECSGIFKSNADDQPNEVLCSKTLEQLALPEIRETKQDESLVLGLGLTDGVMPEGILPINLVDSNVYSSEDDGGLKSLSPSIIDQSPVPQSQSQASPVPSETKDFNSITAFHGEDSLVEDLGSVSGSKTLNNYGKIDEHVVPLLEKSIIQSARQPADEQINVGSGMPPSSAIQGEVLPAMSPEPSPLSESMEQLPLSGRSEAGNGSLTGGSAQPDMMHDGRLLHGAPSFEGETASVSSPESEVVEPALGKVPRPPKRLIEAVAAHDRSMLRKVTERKRPPVEPKENERDSLLEQIRTKSFNLKPAVAARPSIQGPQTNLKVAAILAKANSIRQAFAGSDEDDDDSWSDS